MASYMKRFGRYIVETDYGSKWFKDLSKAKEHFELCKEDCEDSDAVELRDLRTGEILDVYIAPEYKGE